MTRANALRPVLGIVLVVVLLGVGWFVGERNDWWRAEPEPVAAEPTTSTASVSRASVTDEESLAGRLRFQDEVEFAHRVDAVETIVIEEVPQGRDVEAGEAGEAETTGPGAAAQGRDAETAEVEPVETTVLEPGERAVTALPQLGQIIEPGEELYETDSTAVFTALGEVAAWRTMNSETSGDDVAQLQAHLLANGFDDDLVADGVWGFDTTTAVQAWQEATEQVVTGQVDLGDIWFIRGPIRIIEVVATEGVIVADGEPLFTYTSTDRAMVVNVAELPTGLLSAESISARLPDRSTTTADLRSVRGVEDGFELTFDVEGSNDLPQVNGLEVTLTWTVNEIDDALTLPPEAIRRTDSGTTVVDVFNGDTTTPTEVEVIGQAGRLVAISGLVEGTEVVVP